MTSSYTTQPGRHPEIERLDAPPSHVQQMRAHTANGRQQAPLDISLVGPVSLWEAMPALRFMPVPLGAHVGWVDCVPLRILGASDVRCWLVLECQVRYRLRQAMSSTRLAMASSGCPPSLSVDVRRPNFVITGAGQGREHPLACPPPSSAQEAQFRPTPAPAENT